MTKIRLHLAAATIIASTMALPASAKDVAPLTPRELVFSTSNMDRSANPRQDFYRYAAGTWLKTAKRPDRLPRIGPFDYMMLHLNAQMKTALEKASAKARHAAKGTPIQLVGDFYASMMDEKRIDALGMAPLKPELDRIAAIASLQDFARYAGHFERRVGDPMFLGIVPGQDRADNSQMVFYAVSSGMGVTLPAMYEGEDNSHLRQAYRRFVRDALHVSGVKRKRAAAMADSFLAIETALFNGKLKPAEAVDPHNSYLPMSFAELQEQMPNFDLKAYFQGLGVEPPQRLVNTQPRYAAALEGVLRTHSLEELKAFARFNLLRKLMPFLPSGLQEKATPLNKALSGTAETPPRHETALKMLSENLGHPVSKVYVDAYFTQDTRAKATDMITRIKAVFTERMKNSRWLTEPTKKAAIEKLEKLTFAVGYPDVWMDYSKVDIRRNDALGNVLRLQEYSAARDLARVGQPIQRDAFSNPTSTLPIIINAAYERQLNGFEVPAAILQPPVFEAGLDAPVYYCKLGAVIGHEMTHGFDTSGRLFDAQGNMRDWWTPEDSAAFQREADKLVEQAGNYEILPGLRINGKLTVTENMADVGGLTLAYGALQTYLKDHPQENVSVDGLTPDQRCFIAFAQLWTAKETEQSIRQGVALDSHAPNEYRATAALKHIDAFYTAFGVQAGDAMWLPPEKRLKAW